MESSNDIEVTFLGITGSVSLPYACRLGSSDEEVVESAGAGVGTTGASLLWRSPSGVGSHGTSFGSATGCAVETVEPHVPGAGLVEPKLPPPEDLPLCAELPVEVGAVGAGGFAPPPGNEAVLSSAGGS